jgi:hypothetical protein
MLGVLFGLLLVLLLFTAVGYGFYNAAHNTMVSNAKYAAEIAATKAAKVAPTSTTHT